MGISQSTHGTDNTLVIGQSGTAFAVTSASRERVLTRYVAKQRSGCSDSGGLPNVYTAYQAVNDPAVQTKFQEYWGNALSPTPGLTATEMVNGAVEKAIRGMFVVGENPMISEPNQNHTRHALEQLDFLVCQDIFINETGTMADVILLRPASLKRRHIHQHRPTRAALPPGRCAGRPVAPGLGDHQ